MGKTDFLFENTTNQIIEMLDAGEIPWRKPWNGGLANAPRNAFTGREYNGINIWTLSWTQFEDPRWATFNAIRKQGGQVVKGSKSQVVVFWKPIKLQDKESGETKFVPLLRYYRVFNVEQTKGLELPALETDERTPHERIEAAQTLLDGFTASLKGGYHEGEASAYYRPTHDSIHMPKLDAFDTPEDYYCTSFHESCHATGHRTRLARETILNPARYGSHQYSREELIAEFGASFLCAVAGIERHDGVTNSAAYIQSWRKVLRDDPRAVIVAAGRAEKAARWVMGERAQQHDNQEEEKAA